jgi:excisionase family DNA binding protein
MPNDHEVLQSSDVRKDWDWSQFLAGYGLRERSLYSINEVIQRTGLGRTFIYRQIGNGSLSAVRIGRRTLIAAPDLVQFIEARRSVQTNEAA